ncbi:MAG: hypothetical protein M3P30_06370 [Chloroflexota bacterium]|nr:hypothetical protein [Chloroflexota bacterium]
MFVKRRLLVVPSLPPNKSCGPLEAAQGKATMDMPAKISEMWGLRGAGVR